MFLQRSSIFLLSLSLSFLAKEAKILCFPLNMSCLSLNWFSTHFWHLSSKFINPSRHHCKSTMTIIWKISFILNFELNIEPPQRRRSSKPITYHHQILHTYKNWCSHRKEETNFCWAESQKYTALFWDRSGYTGCKLALFELNGNIPVYIKILLVF